MQCTLAHSFTLVGTTLHHGETATVTVYPAPANSGRYFVQGPAQLPALADWVAPTALSTRLERGTFTVRTPEHLLAALAGMGIDNCRIELVGSELPILDGSALPYVQAIEQVGIETQGVTATILHLVEPITVQDGERFVMAMPSSEYRLSYGIDFPQSAIGEQWSSWAITPSTFALELAPARTFTTLAQVAFLQERGLIQGGSLDCALVADTTTWVGQTPRWPNEAARHKTLDLLGDLALVGCPIRAHILAYKAGHDLHVQLAHRLRQLARSPQLQPAHV